MNANLIWLCLKFQSERTNVFALKVFILREFFKRLWQAKSSILKALLFKIVFFCNKNCVFCSGKKTDCWKLDSRIERTMSSTEASKGQGKISNIFLRLIYYKKCSSPSFRSFITIVFFWCASFSSLSLFFVFRRKTHFIQYTTPAGIQSHDLLVVSPLP